MKFKNVKRQLVLTYDAKRERSPRCELEGTGGRFVESTLVG
jgi:hypothetical protein